MTDIILNDDEKASIINSRKKNLSLNKYSFELSIEIENAKSIPDQVTINNYNAQIADIEKQNAVLDAEFAKLNITIPNTPPAIG